MHILERTDIANILCIDEEEISEDTLLWAEQETARLLNKRYEDINKVEILYFSDNEAIKHINLEHTGITVVNSIKEDTTLLDTEEYYVYKDEGLILLKYNIRQRVEYEIDYNYGNETVEDLDRKICFLIVLKDLLIHKADLFEARKDIIKEKIGDYTVEYNLEKLKSRPDMVQDDIDKLVTLAGGSKGYDEGLTL